jgi:hypothetical protein
LADAAAARRQSSAGGTAALSTAARLHGCTAARLPLPLALHLLRNESLLRMKTSADVFIPFVPRYETWPR